MSDVLREALAGIYRSRDMLVGLNWRVQERIIDEDTATLRAALAAAPVAGEGLDELTRDVAASTNVAKWVLPLVLAVRAWRDTPRTRDMRVGQRLELAILDAINDLDEYGADT